VHVLHSRASNQTYLSNPVFDNKMKDSDCLIYQRQLEGKSYLAISAMSLQLPRWWRFDIEIPVCRVVRQPDEVFSTHITLRKRRPTLQIGCRRRETPHALELDRSTPEDYERLKTAQQGPDTAGSRIQPGAPDVILTAVGYFVHWPSRTQPNEVPRRPLW